MVEKTPIDPTLVQRVAAGIRFAFTGKAPEWFGPLTPPQPMAPEEVTGRQFDFQPGINLTTQPRTYESVRFPELRALADNYDLLRLVIETRKDQIARHKWGIKNRDKDKDGSDPRIQQVAEFLAYPDKEHSWASWLRILVEDMLVLDAATVYPRKTKGGKLYALEIIDGATVKRVLDGWGRTPLPPEPAYQQILKGIPAVDYTRDELLYLPRNMRSNRVYGYSPVEQVMTTVNIAIRRQIHQLQFYTEGSTPDLIFSVPTTWNPDQIEQFEQYFNSILSGNTAARRQAKFVPDGVKPYNPREAALKDEYDEWLARIICYAFNVSNQWAIKQMNRATSETAQDQALQEGLAPLLAWVKEVLDRCISQVFGFTDLEFSWEEEEDIDPVRQAQINDTYLKSGTKTLNEIRGELGLDPIEGGDTHLIYTAGGAVTLDVVLNPPEPAPAPAAPPQGGQSSPGKGDAAQEEEKAASGQENAPPAKAEKFAKMWEAKVARGRPVIVAQTDALKAIWADLLKAEAAKMADVVIANAGLTKTSPNNDDPLFNGYDWDVWYEAGNSSIVVLEKGAQDGAEEGLKAIGITDHGITSLANRRAEDYARRRGAEMVGKRWVDGELVDNPNPTWAIPQTTRDMVRGLVKKATDEGWSNDKLKKSLTESFAFSDTRAETIARTELAMADMQGNLMGWRASGVVVAKRWIMSNVHDIDDECDMNAQAGQIPLDSMFPSGVEAPPDHPRCACDLVPIVAGDEDDADKMEGASGSRPFDLVKAHVYVRDARGRFASVPGASDKRLSAWIRALSHRRSSGGKRYRNTIRKIGTVDAATYAAAKRLGLKPPGRILHVSTRNIDHMLGHHRAGKAANGKVVPASVIENLPGILRNPRAVLAQIKGRDTTGRHIYENGLVYVADVPGTSRLARIWVPFDNEMTLPARTGQSRRIVAGGGPHSATMTEAYSLRDGNRFVVLTGKV